MEQTFEIFIDELASDEELLALFFRNPRRTLEKADEWGLPLSTSEVCALLAQPRLLVRVAERLNARLQNAA